MVSSLHLQTFHLHISIGVPADIVPATFKKKRPVAGATRVKGEDGDDKPGRPTEDEERPVGMGRGSRWLYAKIWVWQEIVSLSSSS